MGEGAREAREAGYSVRIRLLLTLVAFVVFFATARAQSSAYAALAFVNSICVNVHLHYTDTPYYSEWTTVKTKLTDLGITCYRDGATDTVSQFYYDRHEELGGMGLQGIFIADIAASSATLLDYPSRVPTAFYAWDGVNEYDLVYGAGFETPLAAQVPVLWTNRGGFPTYGPSLTSEGAYDLLGNVGSYVDAATVHPYYSGRHPETGGWGANAYGSTTWTLENASTQAPGKPVIATETGYFTDSTIAEYVSEAVHAKYMVRLLLEHYRVGITKNYIYELIDFPGSGTPGLHGYGLLREDMTEKPAFVAVEALIDLLGDTGNARPVDNLSYTLTGAGADVREMVFNKGDGSFYLALWTAQSGWNQATSMAETVTDDPVTVEISGYVVATRIHVFQADGTIVPVAISGDPKSFGVTVTDRVQIVEIRPSPARMRRL